MRFAQWSNPSHISIHAPRTGSDDVIFNVPHDEDGFQSTLPARGATLKRRNLCRMENGFQSTLPARGATSGNNTRLKRKNYFNPRSPHGERPEG